jgi:hypothetical protein
MKSSALLKRLRSALGREDGQAMTEYASITGIMLLGGVALSTGWPYFGMFMQAYNNYLGSIFFVLKHAVP